MKQKRDLVIKKKNRLEIKKKRTEERGSQTFILLNFINKANQKVECRWSRGVNLPKHPLCKLRPERMDIYGEFRLGFA